MSPEALIPAIGAACAALGAGLAKWGPELFRLAREWVRARTKLRLRAMEREDSTRDETQKTFEQLGTWKERARALRAELTTRDDRIDELERALDAERAARKKLEAHVERLERAVLEMLGPPAPPDPASNVAELKRRR